MGRTSIMSEVTRRMREGDTVPSYYSPTPDPVTIAIASSMGIPAYRRNGTDYVVIEGQAVPIGRPEPVLTRVRMTVVDPVVVPVAAPATVPDPVTVDDIEQARIADDFEDETPAWLKGVSGDLGKDEQAILERRFMAESGAERVEL